MPNNRADTATRSGHSTPALASSEQLSEPPANSHSFIRGRHRPGVIARSPEMRYAPHAGAPVLSPVHARK